MSQNPQIPHVGSPGASSEAFFIRWRGRQEGPYTLAVIEAKLAANQIGLLHEILHKGQWITLRDYFAERKATFRAEQEAREEQKRREGEEAEQRAKAREEQRRAELLTQERRKNDLLQASIEERQGNDSFRQSQAIVRKPHRAGSILALGIIGLIVCGPVCIATWVMGNNDLGEMDAGIMDDTGRSMTSSGRSLGILGSILWGIAAIVFFIIGH